MTEEDMNGVNETNSRVSMGQPVTLKLAIASPAMVVVGFLALEVFAGYFKGIRFLKALGFSLFYFSMFSAVVIAVVADRDICRSKGKLSGRVFTTLGFVSAIFLPLWITAYSPMMTREHAHRIVCAAHMKQVGLAIRMYTVEFQGRLPAGEKWCDLLVEHVEATPDIFLCRVSDANEGQSCYAMNKNVTGRKLPDPASDVVLLFEAKPGWNQVGGPEMLIPDIHELHEGKGCNVLFADGGIEYIKAEDVGDLKWEVEEEGTKPEVEDVQPQSHEEIDIGTDEDE